jgi:predicted transcriptional regulator
MKKQVNTGITMVDVRMEAFDAIQKLKSGEIDVKTAAEIRNLCGVVIDVAKTQVEFIKAIPNQVREQMKTEEVKAIAGTLVDRDAELDVVLQEIEENKKKPYQLGG